jgi:hypothetical protein
VREGLIDLLGPDICANNGSAEAEVARYGCHLMTLSDNNSWSPQQIS